MIHNLR